MRVTTILVLAAAACTGCATTVPEGSKAAPSAVATGAPAAAPHKGSTPQDVKEALTKLGGYRLVNKDGQQVYCRPVQVTGTRVRERIECLTEQQILEQARNARDGYDEMSRQLPNIEAGG